MPRDLSDTLTAFNARIARQRQLDAAWHVLDLATRAVVLTSAAVLIWIALERVL